VSYNSAAAPSDAVWQSILALTRFAWHASAADGYAIFEINETRDGFVLRDGDGVSSPPPEKLGAARGVVCHDGVTVSSYPLRGDDGPSGLLTFAFCGAAIAKGTQAVLDRLARVIDAVYHLPRATAKLVAKVGGLEVELAAIKISERTLGLLAEGGPATESVEAVVRHVESVLGRRPAGAMLEQLLPDLEDRVAERKLVVQAKKLLQRRDGITEEQAYLRLRHRSRTSGKRLREVAHELIAG
jgi:ANTAR domain-containing protein